MRNYDTDSEAIRLFKQALGILKQPKPSIPMTASDGLLLLAIVFTVCFVIGIVLVGGEV